MLHDNVGTKSRLGIFDSSHDIRGLIVPRRRNHETKIRGIKSRHLSNHFFLNISSQTPVVDLVRDPYVVDLVRDPYVVDLVRDPYVVDLARDPYVVDSLEILVLPPVHAAMRFQHCRQRGGLTTFTTGSTHSASSASSSTSISNRSSGSRSEVESVKNSFTSGISSKSGPAIKVKQAN